ncbi:PulJ/GspJ family protein [Lacipirellula sp.]|uniref:PulJ/GspJ family protein n=1 Tax=Lacipirellula sp. TaxID=2691419 RepID=UPI003D150A81
MTNLFDRLPLKLRALLSRGSTPRQSGDWRTPLGNRSGGSLSRGYWNGLTLIEMLVALAVTLVMMAAVVNLFANISGSIRNRRAAIETGAQLRQVRQRLAMDLNGATCRGTTWQRPEANQGYIEVIEGEWSDKNPSSLIDGNTANGELDYTISSIPSSQAFDSDLGLVADGRSGFPVGAITDGRALGDWDDVLALTVRSESDPFTARYLNAFVESPVAEVVWLATEQGPSATPNPNDGMRRVYRRVLLIAPWLDAVGTNINDPPNNVSAHWDQSRNGGLGCWVANTLADLTKRENRATRRGNSLFPHVYDAHSTAPNISPASVDYQRILPGNTSIDALVLNNALAFDIRVFDPGAPLYTDITGAVLEPVDLGWGALTGGTPTGFGAYCDLGWNWNQTAPGPGLTQYFNRTGTQPIPQFGWPREAGWHPTPVATNARVMLGYPAVYDTWSYHYENDGLDQEQKLLDWFGTFTTPPANLPQFLTWQLNNYDQGANGLDDDGMNGVDDRGERETSPPYDVPLRGIKAILRVYEPDARQVRESSVTHSFQQ